MLLDETLALLGRYRLTADPSKDEQQLVDPKVIALLIGYASVGGSDTVLEVGPGAGNITVQLANIAYHVIAVEREPKWLPLLRNRLAGYGNVELVEGNALTTRFPLFTKVVSNLPYAIAEAFVQRLTRFSFEAASLLVPASFAATATADRGSLGYTKLSYALQLFFAMEKLVDVSSEAYHPEPRTRTAILTLRSKPISSPVDVVFQSLLQQRDRTLGNALREAVISAKGMGYPGTKREARALVAQLGLDAEILRRRVGALSLKELLVIEGRLIEKPVAGTD